MKIATVSRREKWLPEPFSSPAPQLLTLQRNGPDIALRGLSFISKLYTQTCHEVSTDRASRWAFTACQKVVDMAEAADKVWGRQNSHKACNICFMLYSIDCYCGYLDWVDLNLTFKKDEPRSKRLASANARLCLLARRIVGGFVTKFFISLYQGHLVMLFLLGIRILLLSIAMPSWSTAKPASYR